MYLFTYSETNLSRVIVTPLFESTSTASFLINLSAENSNSEALKISSASESSPAIALNCSKRTSVFSILVVLPSMMTFLSKRSNVRSFVSAKSGASSTHFAKYLSIHF